MSDFKDFNKYWNNHFTSKLNGGEVFNGYIINGDSVFFSDKLTGLGRDDYIVFINFTNMKEEFLHNCNSPANSLKLWEYLVELLNNEPDKLSYLPDKIEYYSNHSHAKVNYINEHCLIFDRSKADYFLIYKNFKYM